MLLPLKIIDQKTKRRVAITTPPSLRTHARRRAENSPPRRRHAVVPQAFAGGIWNEQFRRNPRRPNGKRHAGAMRHLLRLFGAPAAVNEVEKL